MAVTIPKEIQDRLDSEGRATTPRTSVPSAGVTIPESLRRATEPARVTEARGEATQALATAREAERGAGVLKTIGRVAGGIAKETVRPVAKSIAGPVAVAKAVAGEEVDDINFNIPLLGDITPAKTVRGGIGQGLQTALLGVGARVAGTVGKGVAKAIAKEATVGAGFGLGIGLEEEKRGRELIVPTAEGAAFGALIPPAFSAGRNIMRSTKRVIGQTASKVTIPKNLKTKIREGSTKLADTQPVKFVSSVGTRLKRLGEPGEKIVEGFENIDKEKLLRSGAAMDQLDMAGFSRMSNKEAGLLLDAMEGRLQRELLPENVRATFDAADAIRKEIANEAEKVGLRIRVKRGLDLPFKGRENFFPHFVPNPKNLVKGNLREEVIENAVRLKRFPSASKAEEVLDAYIEFDKFEGRGAVGKAWLDYLVETGQAKNRTEARGLANRVFKLSRLKKFGNLEQARLVDFPFFDPDPRRVLPKYILGSFDRLETVKQFGLKSQKLNNLLGRIHNLKGVTAGKEASRLVKSITNAIERSPKSERFSQFVRALQIPKLAFAQIINIGQPIVNGILRADAPSLAFGLKSAFTQIGKQRALRAGSTLDSTIRETLNKAGTDGTFANKFLKLTGFTASEKFNRVVAANTGMRWLERTFERLKKDSKNPVLRARITELGLDPDTLLKKGVKEKDLLTAGQKFTNVTQFRGRGIDLPEFVNSPAGKVFFQFKTFAFSQSKLLKDTLKRDIQNRNFSGLMRTLFVLSTVFPLTGEALQDIRALVTGSPRPTDGLDRYIDNIVSAGGLGIASDLWRSAEFGDLSSALAGPGIGTAIKGTEKAVQSINAGKVNDSTIKFLIDQFGILRPLKNAIFPPKPR